MKNHFLFLFAFIFLFSACEVEPVETPSTAEQVMEKVHQWELNTGQSYGLDLQLVDSCMRVSKQNTSGSGECYELSDLFSDLLPNFSKEYLPLIPANPWHIQDVNFCSLGRLQGFVYERNPDGSISWAGSSGAQWDSIIWVIDGVEAWRGPYLQFETYAGASCGGYQPECNGLHDCEMICFYEGAEYRRGGEILALINNVPDNIPECGGGLIADPWYNTQDSTFYFEHPNPFLVPASAKGDLNGDYKVNTLDLVHLLLNLCI